MRTPVRDEECNWTGTADQRRGCRSCFHDDLTDRAESEHAGKRSSAGLQHRAQRRRRAENSTGLAPQIERALLARLEPGRQFSKMLFEKLFRQEMPLEPGQHGSTEVAGNE